MKYQDYRISQGIGNCFRKIDKEPIRKPNSLMELIIYNIMNIENTEGKLKYNFTSCNYRLK